MTIIRSFIAVFSVLFALLFSVSLSSSEASEAGRASLAIYPFNDVNKEQMDMGIPAMLQTDFSSYDFIEIVPVEVTRERLYTIEPRFLWTEQDGPVKRGGILWKIEQEVVEKINDTLSAQFSLYGDVMRAGNQWEVDIFISKDNNPGPAQSYGLSGKNYKEVSEKLAEISREIAVWIRRENRINEAEEDMRRYMGKIYTYNDALGKMKDHVQAVSDSIPLRALLLDLYLKEKDMNREAIVHNGMKIIALLDHPGNDDVRYLLSLNLDPFDAVADIYERRENWKDAIDIRNDALKKFPYKKALHEGRIGRDHYFIAKSHEETGLKVKAMESYKAALPYLPPSSEYFKSAMDGIDRLKER